LTVVVAVKCPEGVVLATDSQGTSMVPGSQPVKSHAKKIERLGKHVVYAGTGAQGAGQRVHAELLPHAAKMNPAKPPSHFSDLIRGLVNPIQQKVKGEWVQLPGTQPDSWGAIFCGWSSEGPWIFEVDAAGGSQFQDPLASTGSGMVLAHTALVSVSHFQVGQQSLEGIKAIAYRAIESTCASAAFGVGMPVQLAIVTEAGVEELNDGDERHTELKELIDLWKAKEIDTLGKLAPRAGATEENGDGEADGETVPGIDENEIETS
jgi:20S proteasome alpha/beta subunit